MYLSICILGTFRNVKIDKEQWCCEALNGPQQCWGKARHPPQRLKKVLG